MIEAIYWRGVNTAEKLINILSIREEGVYAEQAPTFQRDFHH